MKPSLYYSALLLFLLFLSYSSKISARSMATQQGEEEINLNDITSGDSLVQIEELMGMEVCDSGDEECLKRRIISEAHLDYIYTQHHKP